MKPANYDFNRSGSSKITRAGQRAAWISGAALGFFVLLRGQSGFAQLQVVPPESVVAVFAGEDRRIPVTFRNQSADPKATETPIHTRVYLAASSTVALSDGPREWKRLATLGGQTVVESKRIAFPAVRAKSRFLIQWLDDHDQVLGLSEVMVYPTNLLQSLKALAGGKPLGLLDPQDELRPLLESNQVATETFSTPAFPGFTGQLVLVGRYPSAAATPMNLGQEIAALAKSGVAVVWIQPGESRAAAPGTNARELPLEPALYPLRVGRGAVTIVHARALTNLAESPRAQLNLLRAAELAINPELLCPPELKP